MTKEKQIEILLELDGWQGTYETSHGETSLTYFAKDRMPRCSPPDYLNSRDAIIPLIAKYINKTSFNYKIFLTFLQKSAKVDMNGRNLMVTFLLAPPAKLAEALIRALGRWEE